MRRTLQSRLNGRKGLLQRFGFAALAMSLMVLFAAPQQAYAQQKTISVSGVIIDTDGAPLPGATVMVKGQETGGTTSKGDGTFALTVPQNSTLVFSFLGYQEQEQVAAKQMTIIMESDAQRMEDVVIIGYTRQSMRDVSASVAKIDMKQIENNPSVSLANMLAGQAAGMQTVTRSGVPGASGSGLVIRGNTSLSSSNDITGISNPLYIVDGIPMALQDLAGYNVTDNDFLSSLNPQDIQSIDILKDAAATAIYGSRGANGVVIITTRKGTSGKPRITARITQGIIEKPAKLPVYVGQEERDAKLALLDQTFSTLFGEKEWWDIRHNYEVKSHTLPHVLTDKYNPAFNNAYDYQEMFYRAGTNQTYDLSLEGGNNSNSYRVSIGHYNEKGVLVGYGLTRTNLQASLVTDVSKKIRNELVIRYTQMDREGGLNDQMKAMPTSPIDLPSSLFYRTPEELKQLSGQLGDAYNSNVSHSLSIGETLRVGLAENLSWDNQLSLVMDFGRRDYFIPSSAREDKMSYAYASSSINTTLNANSVVNYTKEFGSENQHGIVAMAGMEVNSSVMNSLRVEAQNGTSDYLNVVQGYKQEDTWAYSDIVKNNMLSFFTMLSYGYMGNRYKVEAVFRADGSSRFGANNKWATFPSVKAHWAFSEEEFMEFAEDYLDFGKVRVSYGTSGDIYYDPLLQYNSLIAISNIGAGLNWMDMNKMDIKTYGGSLALISDFNKIANRDLSWSRSQEINYGIDLEFFDRRLNITADLYSKYLSGMVYTSELPSYVGFSSLKSNLVDMIGNGYEFAVNAYLFPRNSEIQWDWTLNLGRSSTVIAKLGNGGKDYINSGECYAFIEGAPAFQYYMPEYIGALDYYSDLPVEPFTGEAMSYLYADAGLALNLQGRIFPGMPMFTDVNGDYKVDGANYGNDVKIIEGKTPEPKITGGLHTGFRYKDLQIRVSTSFAFGHTILNTTKQKQLGRLDDATTFYQYALYKFYESEFWHSPEDGSYYPMMYINYWEGGGCRAFRTSSMFLEPGDYWSLDNVTISYNLPKPWVEKLHMRGINVYATGTNLFMWKRSSVTDPRMVSRTGHYNGAGYPISKTLQLGLQLQF